MTPSWMTIAAGFIGLRETPGPANNNTIMGWAKSLGVRVLGMDYANDATPWCGLFVANCIRSAGLLPAKIAVRAKAWATWGVPVDPCEGAVLVFERQGGGHVGFYAGETAGPAGAYLVLGGNQGDAVSKTWISKARCVASRWPDHCIPLGNRIMIGSAALALSRNEA
jgi:uncharacterized protein (TIGR02594 family)